MDKILAAAVAEPGTPGYRTVFWYRTVYVAMRPSCYVIHLGLTVILTQP